MPRLDYLSPSEALQIAASVIEHAQTIRGTTQIGQSYEIRPGTYDVGQRILILGHMGMGETWYLMWNGLYRTATHTFLHNYMVGEVASRTYQMTKWIVPATKATMALSFGIAGGALPAELMILNLATLSFRVTVFCANHAEEVQKAGEHLQVARAALRWIAQHAPVTYTTITALALRSLPKAVWEGFNSADGASFLGLFAGCVMNPGAGFFTALRLTLSTLLVRLPGMIGRGGLALAGEAFVQAAQKQGVPVSAADRAAILAEFQRNPELPAKLKELHEALDGAGPVVERLAQAFEMMPDARAKGVISLEPALGLAR